MAPLVFKQGRAYLLSRWFGVYQLYVFVLQWRSSLIGTNPTMLGFINPLSLSTLRVYQLYVFVLQWRSSLIGTIPTMLGFINPQSLSTLCLCIAVEITPHRNDPHYAGVYQLYIFVGIMSLSRNFHGVHGSL